MESNEVTDVRVVEVVPDYVTSVKLAIITGIATVVMTEVTLGVIAVLKAKAKERRLNKKISEADAKITNIKS